MRLSETEYEKYKKNPDSFNKSYDGNVIMKVMEGAEMYSKLAVIEPSEYGLKPVVVYTVSDNVLANRERIIDALAVGEEYGQISEYFEIIRCAYQPGDISRYFVGKGKKSRKSSNGTSVVQGRRQGGSL